MKQQLIDAHIHLDKYAEHEQTKILNKLDQQQIVSLISVSSHLKSSKNNLRLSREDKRIKPAFGFHPEQPLLTDDSLDELISFMRKHHEKMIAVGEVGLP